MMMKTTLPLERAKWTEQRTNQQTIDAKIKIILKYKNQFSIVRLKV